MTDQELLQFLSNCFDIGIVRDDVFLRIVEILKEYKPSDRTEKMNYFIDLLEDFDISDKRNLKEIKKKLAKIKGDKQYEYVHLYIESTILYYLDDREKGFENLQRCIEEDGERKDLAYEALGYYYVISKKYEEAIDAFDKAIILNSKRIPLSIWGKGVTYAQIRDFDRAEACFNMYKNYDVMYTARALQSLSELWDKRGDIPRAIKLLEDGVNAGNLTQRKSIDLQIKLIDFYTSEEMYERAKEKIILLKKMNVEASKLRNRIRLIEIDYLISSSQFAEAELELQDFQPQFMEPFQRMEFVLLEIKLLEKKEQYLDALDKLIKIDEEKKYDKNIRYRINNFHLRILKKAQKHDELLAQVDKLLKNEEIKKFFKFEMLYQRANALHLLGRSDEAIAQLEVLLSTVDDAENKKNSSTSVLLLGKIFLEKKEYERAKAQFSSLELHSPSARERANGFYYLAVIARRSDKNIALSLEYIDKAIATDNSINSLVPSYLLKHSLYLDLNKLAEAEEALDNLLGHEMGSEDRTSILLKKAKFFKNTAKLDAALGILVSISKMPGTYKTDVYYEMGEIRLAFDEWEKAKECFQISSACAVEPEDKVLADIGEALSYPLDQVELKALDLIANSINQNIFLQEQLAAIFSKQLILKYKQDRSFDPVANFDRLIKVDAKDNSYLDIAKGKLFFEAKEFQRALEHFTKFKERSDLDSDLKEEEAFLYNEFLIAKCYFMLKDLDMAKASAEWVQRNVQRDSGERYLQKREVSQFLSRVYFEVGEYQLSKKHLESAIEAGSNEIISIFSIDEKISEQRKQEQLVAIAADPNVDHFIGLEGDRTVSSREKNKTDMPGSVFNKFKSNLDGQKTEVDRIFEQISEVACHYTKIETALFYILPSKYNHSASSEKVILRLNSLGEVNDIEEGKFKLRTSDNNILVRKNFENLQKKIRDEIKVLCFSWSNNRYKDESVAARPYLLPPMWSRYSERHSGVCIIFDLNQLKVHFQNVCSEKAISISKFQRVAYANIFDQKDINVSVTQQDLLNFNNDYHLNSFFKDAGNRVLERRLDTFFFKPPHWNYEKEFRLVVHKDVSGPLLFGIPKACVRGIIAGKEILPGYKTLLKEVCLKNSWFLLDYNPIGESSKLLSIVS